MAARQVALLALLAAVWGASYLLIKYGLEGFSPAEIVFLRSALAAAVLFVVVRAQDGAALAALRAAPRQPGWRWGLLLGVLAVALPFVLISYGERAVPSGLTAVLISPSSLFVAAFAPFVDRSEAIDRSRALGMVLGLVGVALLVGVETLSSLSEFLGALAILGASASYALSGFVVKGPFGSTPATASTAVSMAVAALVTLPVAAATAEPSAPGARAVLAVLCLGVVGTAAAFVLYYKLIGELGAGRASLVSYLAPGFALVYGAVLLGEPVTAAAVTGLALIVAGVAIAGRPARTESPRREPGLDDVAVSSSGSAAPQPASARR